MRSIMCVGQPYFFLVAHDENSIALNTITPNNFATLLFLIINYLII
jgi:hypothetical protein